MPSLLITDDHPLYIDGLENALKQYFSDLVIFTAHNIEDSETCLLKHPDMDFLLLGRTLNDADALPYISTFLQLATALRIAVISTWESQSSIQEALRAGAIGFIPKRFDAPAIAHAIKRLLNEGKYIPHRDYGATISQRFPNNDTLTTQQYKVLPLIAQGYTNKDIARELGVSEGTIKQYIHTLFKKLAVKNRTHAVQVARMRGIIC